VFAEDIPIKSLKEINQKKRKRETEVEKQFGFTNINI